VLYTEAIARSARKSIRSTIGHVLSALGTATQEAVAVLPLAAGDVTTLRLSWESHFTRPELAEHLEEHPTLACRVPGANEYCIGDLWQERSDIGVILEVAGDRHRASLVDGLLAAFRAGSARMVLLSQDEERRALRFYQSRGWSAVQEILVYRRTQSPVPHLESRLAMATLTPPRLPDLMALEIASFPWLWRFGEPYLQQSAVAPNRRLLLGYEGNRLAGYFIIAWHGNFGHLDRLAVDPALQGSGYGAELLARALHEMAARGASTMGLSTQNDNYRSQSLYERFGFQRAGAYTMYGNWVA
jgi:ribosomal protein S18 acetylase RimI-like enzyme